MSDAMLGLIEEMELRIQHLRTLAELQANVREQNATLMREVARLRAENRALNNIIDQAGVRNRVNLYA
jgi:glucose-6-phosphate-specific signal transduction histidine kinase